ncbi:MAG TPA: hypothetical protein VF115_12635 [Acidimicrobiia bacterium]
MTSFTVKTTTALRKARMGSFESYYRIEYNPLLAMAIALTSDFARARTRFRRLSSQPTAHGTRSHSAKALRLGSEEC